MNIAIITEYNPFHNGHKYQIDKIKELYPTSNIIIIMSGNFVQRGDVAISSKFLRTEMAINCGADIVLEIPQIFATSSAMYFAKGSVAILNNLGIIDKLCFGCENTDVETLTKIAKFLIEEPNDFKEILQNHLKDGHSYPKSRYMALSAFGFSDTIKTPNNILGVEYIKSLLELNSKIEPIVINRTNDYHEKDIVSTVTSATSIRQNINNLSLIEKTIPSSAFEIFKKDILDNNYNIDNLSSIFSYIFNSKPKNELLQIIDLNEDLYNRFSNTMKSTFLISDIVEKMASKNYATTRIRRIILNVILNNTQRELETSIKNGYSFVRVLGFKKEKQTILSNMISNSKIKIVTNLKNADKILNSQELELLNIDIQKTNNFIISNDNKNNIISTSEFENKIIFK